MQRPTQALVIQSVVNNGAKEVWCNNFDKTNESETKKRTDVGRIGVHRPGQVGGNKGGKFKIISIKKDIKHANIVGGKVTWTKDAKK